MDGYPSYKIGELKELLKLKGLPVSGKKTILIERLRKKDKDDMIEAGIIELYLKSIMGSFKTVHIKKTANVSELREKVSIIFNTIPSKIILRRPVRNGKVKMVWSL